MGITTLGVILLGVTTMDHGIEVLGEIMVTINLFQQKQIHLLKLLSNFKSVL